MACVNAEKKKINPRTELVIVLDDLDFSWTKLEVAKATVMWNSGYSITDMAGVLRPYDNIQNAVDEVALLILHLGRQRKIEPRKGGIYGDAR